MSFPIKSSQIFTTHPPANYSTIMSNRPTGLSAKSKLALGIAIPATLLLLLSLLLAYCYLRLYKRMDQHKPMQEPKPSLQAHQQINKIAKLNQPWSHDPTVYHSTPRLQQISYPVPLQINRPHLTTQAITRKSLDTRATSTTDALSPRSSPPPRVPGHYRSSIQSAMRQNWNSYARTKSKVSFNTSGRMPRKKKRTGWKDSAGLEDLFG